MMGNRMETANDKKFLTLVDKKNIPAAKDFLDLESLFMDIPKFLHDSHTKTLFENQTILIKKAPNDNKYLYLGYTTVYGKGSVLCFFESLKILENLGKGKDDKLNQKAMSEIVGENSKINICPIIQNTFGITSFEELQKLIDAAIKLSNQNQKKATELKNILG